MKRIIIFISLSLGIIHTANSQSYENIGDSLMAIGKYREAVNSYMQANGINSSSGLEQKISLARSVETALANSKLDGQGLSQSKKTAISLEKRFPGNVKVIDHTYDYHNTNIFSMRFLDGFNGIYMGLANVKMFSVSLGYNVYDEIPQFRLSLIDFDGFPLSFDYTFIYFYYGGEWESTPSHTLGIGSCYIISRKFTIDYGLGGTITGAFIPNYSFDESTGVFTDEGLRPYVGVSTRVGFTYNIIYGLFSLSYAWVHGYTANYPEYYLPYNYHVFSVSYNMRSNILHAFLKR